VSYKVTEEEQSQLVQKMRDFNAENYLLDRGWLNQDGTPNVKKITEDVYILENAEKMFKSGWTQAKEKAKMTKKTAPSPMTIPMRLDSCAPLSCGINELS
jgi:hypothetical protein